MLRRAIGAPHQFDWSTVASSDIFNPRHAVFDDGVLAAIRDATAPAKALLEQLGAEAAQTTKDELKELRASGVAVVLQKGESPFTKVGRDVVYTTAMGSGEGIAASKSNMPRLLEVEGRIHRAGKDVLFSVAGSITRKGILTDDELRLVGRIIKDWHP